MFDPNPPVEVTIQLQLGAYQPLFRMTVQQSIKPMSQAEKAALEGHFERDAVRWERQERGGREWEFRGWMAKKKMGVCCTEEGWGCILEKRVGCEETHCVCSNTW